MKKGQAMKWKLFILVAGAVWLALLLPQRVLAQYPSCTAARFLDWKDYGCGLKSALSRVPCPPCDKTGMPRWWMSEPYQNVWVADEPLSYSMSSGERMRFRWTYRQRSRLPEAWRSRERNRYEVIPIQLGEDFVNWGDSCQGVTSVRTNAAWSHNWWSGMVLWDTFQETNSILPNNYAVDYSTSPPETYFPYSGTYSALALLGDGGVLNYEGPTVGQANGEGKPRLEIVGPASALGGPRIPVPVPGWNPYPTNSEGVIWVEQPRFGFRLVYPDGRQDVYGFVFQVGIKPLCPIGDPLCVGRMDNTARMYLTQRIDPQGRITRLGYQQQPLVAGQPAYALRYVVDPDGRTNTYSYNSTNRSQLLRIDDPYGRSAAFGYDPVYGTLTSIVDAVQLTNTFQYQTATVTNWNEKPGFPVTCYGPPDPAQYPYATNRAVPVSGWLSSYTTPYGTTSFEYYDQLEPSYTEAFYQKRTVRVTEPDGSQQLFLYDHKTPTVTPTSVSAVPTVTGWTFDTGTTGSSHPQLYHRNSFHWGPRQYAALSGLVSTGGALPGLLNTISNNASAYHLAQMKHWLFGNDDISVLGLLSAERAPSPDAQGQTEGAWTWYDYAGKPAGQPNREPTGLLVGCEARLLSDGTTQYTSWDYNTNGLPTQQRESYTQPGGGVGVRTDDYQYATNGVDRLSVSNSMGQFLNYSWNTNHQVTGVTNTLNEVTSVSYLGFPTENKPWVITFPGGQTATFNYYTGYRSNTIWYWLPEARFVKSIQWNPGPTWSFGYDKGLVKNATNDLGLWLAFTWDDLLRPTSASFPDGTYTSNRYDRLDLVATRDRLGNWTYAGYDALQHLTAITNANNAVTRLDWCGCGALNSIVDALTNTTLLYYDNQGRQTKLNSTRQP